MHDFGLFCRREVICDLGNLETDVKGILCWAKLRPEQLFHSVGLLVW